LPNQFILKNAQSLAWSLHISKFSWYSNIC